MRRAVQSDQSLVVDILSSSFDENKSVNHVVKQDSLRRRRIKALMDYSFTVCRSFGEIWISENECACALLLYPDRKKTTVRSVLWDLELAFRVIGLSRVVKVMDRESKIKQCHPTDSNFVYLWFIGVDPNSQKKGLGTALLKKLVGMHQSLPIYLETSVTKNLSWYRKFGFQVYKEVDLGYTLYLLRRPPVPLSENISTKIAIESF
jgi:ribosomal protein S18 acetylase RimI-like enzyme